jgi:hypothetical protein
MNMRGHGSETKLRSQVCVIAEVDHGVEDAPDGGGPDGVTEARGDMSMPPIMIGRCS